VRVTIEVPDQVARDAVREYRTVRQQAEYLIARSLEPNKSSKPQAVPTPSPEVAR
jgi:hypothetical protein